MLISAFVIWGRCLFTLDVQPSIYGPTSAWAADQALSPLPQPWADCSKELREACLYTIFPHLSQAEPEST